MSSADAITVEAALTEAELDAYAAAMGARVEAAAPPPALLPFALAGCAVALAGTLLALALGATTPADGFSVALLLFGAYAAGYGVMVVTHTRYTARLTRLERGGTHHLREAARYEITGAGISAVSATTRAFWGWAALSGAAVERGLLLVRTGPTLGFAIPVRAFPDAAAAEAAARVIQARIKAARAGV